MAELGPLEILAIGINLGTVAFILHDMAWPSLKKKFFPTVLQEIEKGDMVLVDLRKVHSYEWNRTFKDSSSLIDSYDALQVFMCGMKLDYTEKVFLEDADSRKPILEIEREEPLIAIYYEECQNCGSDTVFHDKKNEYLCPFCEL